MFFRIPQNVYHGYQLIRRTPLVRDRNYTESALREFESILNSCQPDEETLTVHSVVKFFFMANNKGFGNMIRHNNAEAFVLWTNAKTIVRWFGLVGVVYLQYDKNTHLYHVDVHQALKNEDGSIKIPYKPGQVLPTNYPHGYNNRGYNNRNDRRGRGNHDRDGFQQVNYRQNRYNNFRNDQPYDRQPHPNTKSLDDFPAPEKTEYSRKVEEGIKNLKLKEDNDDPAFQILDRNDSWSDGEESKPSKSVTPKAVEKSTEKPAE